MNEVRILDAYPAMALNEPGQTADVVVELEGAVGTRAEIRVHLLDLGRPLAETSGSCVLGTDGASIRLTLLLPDSDPCGYTVSVEASWPGGKVGAATAILAASDWRSVPRYGFLSDFEEPREASASHPVATLARFHITAVQFYDWMYRHYRFLPPDEAVQGDSLTFVDAMGRPVSLVAVRDGVDGCHQYGMAAIAYGAVYGAEPEFILQHPDWLLYDAESRPQHLIERFYITDLRPGPWREHIMREFEAAVAEMHFDGIHLDQYGFPRMAYASDSTYVDIGAQFPSFIDEAARRVAAARDGAGVVFNAVNDWPIDQVASTDQAAVYIEVWSPHDSYRDLVELVRRARSLSRKQVILAAYLTPFHHPGPEAEWSLRYATAVINSAGGHHLVLGEANRVLREPYYPDHGPLTLEGVPAIRRYYDHTAALTSYLHPLNLEHMGSQYVEGVNTAITLVGATASPTPEPGKVWISVAKHAQQFVLNLVNLTAIASSEWNAPRQAPPILAGLTLVFDPFFRDGRITWSTPDSNQETWELHFTVQADGKRSVALPPLELWATIVMNLR